MSFADSTNPNSLASRLRRHRGVALKALISDLAGKRGEVEILDMGGTFNYWRQIGLDFLASVGAEVTVINLAPDALAESDAASGVLQGAVGDACDMPDVADNQFDLAHSNSVIEHVQTWENMKRFAAEIRRVARCYYVQTPYFWFPVDPHYYRFPLFHWLPRPTRARLLNALPIAHSGRLLGVDAAFRVADDARLLDRRQFTFLFPDAEQRFERVAGLAKSMIAIRGPEPGGPVQG